MSASPQDTLRSFSFREWLRYAEPFAYGELNLTPELFSSLTPREFYAMIEGYRRREERTLRQIALIVSNINAVHVKHPKGADWYYRMWTVTPQETMKETFETSVRPKLERQQQRHLRLVK